MNAATPLLVKSAEMAAMLSVSKSSLYQLVQRGVIPVVRMGTITRFDPEAVLTAVRDKGQP